MSAYLGGLAKGVPASQTNGGYNSGNNITNGTPGYLGSGGIYGNGEGSYSSGGGGGLYGGPSGGISSNQIQAGGGGSSYISGHDGCKTYDGYVFSDTIMIDGNGFEWKNGERGDLLQMPNPLGGLYELGKGHIGCGYCKISLYR